MPAPADPAHHDASAAVERDARALREIFRERRLSIRTMDRPLRLATGAAIGCMIGSVALVALRDRSHSLVTLGITDGVRTTVGTPLFVATLVFLAVGLGYLLSGLVMAHWGVAIASIGGLAALMGYETGVLPIGNWRAVLPHWGTTATRILLAAIVLVAVAVLLYRRGRPGDHHADARLRLAVLAVYIALVGGYLVVLWVASPTVNGLTNFPETIDLLMVDIALLATPMLQIAAVDFAEWGELTTERLHATRWAVRGWLVPALGCAGLLVIGCVRRGSWHAIVRSGGQALLLLGLGLAVVIALGLALGVHRRSWPHTANAATLFVLTALTAWVIVPLVGTATGAVRAHPTATVSETGEYTAAADVRTMHTKDGATLLVPAGWHAVPGTGADGFAGTDPTAGSVRLVVARYPVALSPDVVAASLKLTPRGIAQKDGELLKLPVAADGDGRSDIWTLPSDTRPQATYVLYGVVSGRDPEKAELELAAMVHSFRAAGQRPAALPSASEETETPAAAKRATTDRLLALGMAADVAISLVLLVLLFTVGGRWSAQVRLFALLFPFVSLFTVLYFGDSVARVLFGRSTPWPILTRDGVLIGVGLLGLVALALAARVSASWGRRVPAAVTALSGGTLALVGAEFLYSRALAASRIAIWAAVVVLVAVAWDVTMSGESLTNHASRLWPRCTRLLAFFGYTILVGATVVYYGGQRAAGSGHLVEAFFEPESVTLNALFRVAFPVLVLLSLLKIFGTRDPRPSDPDPVNAPSGEPEPAPA